MGNFILGVAVGTVYIGIGLLLVTWIDERKQKQQQKRTDYGLPKEVID